MRGFRCMFMGRSQTIYLLNLFFQCCIGGAFSGCWGFQINGLGTRFYSLNLLLGCLVACLYCYFSTDMRKKKWIFVHYRKIDLAESVFFSLTEMSFFFIYLVGGYDPYSNMTKVLQLFFAWSMFYKVVHSFINIVIPNIGDVFEQSLYKNQIDYQNHSNAENLMCCLGNAVGAGISFAIGDFFKFHPYMMFFLVWTDWIGLWARWQFYFDKRNYSVIKRNFARDFSEWHKKNKVA